MTSLPDPLYDLRGIRGPALAGGRLRLATSVLESPVGQLLVASLLRAIGVSWLRRQPFDDPPTFALRHAGGAMHTSAATIPQQEWPGAGSPPADGFQFATVHDYAKAYRAGTTTPAVVAERVWRAITESNEAVPPLRAVIAAQREDLRRQAEAALQRIRRGTALGVLDGERATRRTDEPLRRMTGLFCDGTEPAAHGAGTTAWKSG